jgi:hypothetical protein
MSEQKLLIDHIKCLEREKAEQQIHHRIIFRDMQAEIAKLDKLCEEMCSMLERRVINGVDRARVIQAWRGRKQG